MSAQHSGEVIVMRNFGLLCASSLIIACASAGGGESDWVRQKISDIEMAPIANPPQAIYRSTFEGRRVIYITPKCCDIPDQLYSEQGELLCAPSGGITGAGDGRCPGFFDNGKRKPEMQLIWRDDRKP
jgi:hypothetical protein